ncbi:MAG: 50S ribosomal protein L4 [bacterium]|nr:MAG: 50S ribosomal protein L4 [bacterium]
MPQVEILNTKREVVGKVDLAAWWGEPPSVPIVHQAVVSALAGARRGSSSSKGRSEVRGGGAKPFRQKGTGRARQGTIRAPQMRGGGVVFGPKPRDFSKSMNKKMSRKALRSALAHKAATDALLVLDGVAIENPKTRELVALMDNLDVISALLVLEEIPETLQRASSNLRWLKIVTTDRVNTYDVLGFEKLIVTKGALEALEGALSR